ncbi:ribosome maturation factor RimM [Calothrix sp. NIES-3974]|uniref:ribosome maturation factor RimM n=1 Tax=Calothrix sp. NIES-3974 TaxID=2005462 RepID=UPI000B5E2CC6|nr:16S rRNA processing protein RimM [Calothrix sp. NIES-3974]
MPKKRPNLQKQDNLDSNQINPPQPSTTKTPAMTPIPDGWLEIGTIVAAHGLSGEMRVYPSTDFPERFEVAGTRWLLPIDATEPTSVKLIAGSYLEGKNLYLIKLAGVTNRNAAEELRGCRILVREDDRPQLEEGEYHIADLVGCQVYIQENNQLVGVVVNVIPAGNDLLEVERWADDTENHNHQQPNILIPFVEAIVPVVDISAKRMEITPPDGLLEINQ